MAITKRIEDLTDEDIETLIRDGTEESLYLDFKREPWGNSDGDRKEFLFDVTAFANAYGGYILVGIEEEKVGGVPRAKAIANVANAATLADDLQKVMLSAIDPRLPGASIRSVLTTCGTVLAIHIPRSSRAPHMVTYKGTNKFYCRHGREKLPMSVGEVGDAFTLAGRTTERALQALEDFIQSARESTPAEPTLVLASMPLLHYARPIDPREEWAVEFLNSPPNRPASFGIDRVDPRAPRQYQTLPSLAGLTRQINSTDSDLTLHRCGMLTYRTGVLNRELHKEIDPRLMISGAVHFLRISATLAKHLGHDGEIATQLLLLAPQDSRSFKLRPVPQDRHQMLQWPDSALPCAHQVVDPEATVWVTTEKPDRAAQRMLDIVFQAFGHKAAPCFDDAGGYDRGILAVPGT